MRHILITLSYCIGIVGAFAGEPKAVDGKALATVETGPLYLGSINSGFKVSEDYLDANLNLVAPVWSSLGSDGLLGGGILFLEPYVSWGENGEVATSLGLGYRYLFNDQPVSALRSPREDQAGFWDEGLAIGANFFVDLLDTEADNRFWQLGFGLELATRYIELRGNYYLPLSDRQLAERRVINESQTSSHTTTRPVTQTGAPYDDGQGFLVQDQTTSLVATTTTTTTLIRHIFERYEEGMEGWDAEVALLVPGLDKYCDVKLIGGYFQLDNSPFGPQKGGTGNVEGWKAGVEVRPVPAVALTGMWYEDERFLGSDWMFGARMEIPFEVGDLGDGKGMWGRIRDAFTPRRRHLVERMAEPVHRQNAAIHIANTHKEESKVAKQSTSSTTQVISQTKNKIVLGPGPSATNFSEVASGTLTLGAMSYSGGMSWHTAHIEGTLYSNQIGNSIFVPADGSPSIVMSTASISSPGGIGAAISFVSNGVTNSFGGTLRLTGASVVGSSAGLTFNADVNMGSSFSINAATATINNGTLGAMVTAGSGALTLSGLNSSTFAAARTLSVDGTGMVQGQLINGGGIAPGSVITTIASSISTDTLIGGGTLSLGTGSLTVSGIPRVLTATNGTTTNVTLNSGTESLNVSGIISGGGSLTKLGAGTLILNATNTYTGVTTVNAGTLVARTWGSLGSQTNLSIGAVTGTGAIILPQGDTGTPPTSIYIQNGLTINGTAVPAGTYPVQNGVVQLGGTTTIQLSGAVLSNTVSGITAGVAALGTVVRIDPSISSSGSAVLPTTFNWNTVNALQLSTPTVIGGTTFSAGTYPISSGILQLNSTSVPLSGATITAPTTP